MKYTQEKFNNIIDYWTEVCPVEQTVEILSPPQVMKSSAGYYIGRMCYDKDCNATVPYDRISEYYTNKAEAVKILGETQIKMESPHSDMWDAGFWELAVFAEIIEPNK